MIGPTDPIERRCILRLLELLVFLTKLLLSWRFYLSVFASAIVATLAWIALPESLKFIVVSIIAVAGPIGGLLWQIRADSSG